MAAPTPARRVCSAPYWMLATSEQLSKLLRDSEHHETLLAAGEQLSKLRPQGEHPIGAGTDCSGSPPSTGSSSAALRPQIATTAGPAGAATVGWSHGMETE